MCSDNFKLFGTLTNRSSMYENVSILYLKLFRISREKSYVFHKSEKIFIKNIGVHLFKNLSSFLIFTQHITIICSDP